MNMRRCLGLVLVLSIAVSGLSTPTVAASSQNNAELLAGFERSSGSFNMTISAGKIKKASIIFSLEAGGSVTINASYTPTSASVDFGLADSNNGFTYINVTNGSINNGVITVTKRGTYTLAVRNNSSNQIDVTGYVDS